MPLSKLQYLFGQPQVAADLRTSEADFQVSEVLPFTPSGEGEHVYIHLRKTGENTAFVARQLAKHFQVKDNLVSYAGLKDKFAVTEQWFSVHLPGNKLNDLAPIDLPNIEVLTITQHNKKLKIGSLSGNRFVITLRNVSDTSELERRWLVICQHGVPNYFGEQRFGINGGNIEKAKALFAGQKVKDKKKRSMYLSAARSLIFNRIISQRLEYDNFEKILLGDVLMLAGSQSIFNVDDQEEIKNLDERLKSFDLDISAPLWGAGELRTDYLVKEIEQSVADTETDICQGLAKFGLKQERRRIRLTVNQPEIKTEPADNTVQLAFNLDAGSFATTILRELVNYNDLTVRRGSL